MSDNDDIQRFEQELRAEFARHEPAAGADAPLRRQINAIAVRRRRKRFALRAAGAALAVLIAVGAPVYGRTLAAPEPTGGEMLADGPVASPTSVLPDRALNFLLLGLDGPSDRDRSGGFRADSVLIVHVPQDRSRSYLMSLPRDLGVDIPGYRRAKLTETFYLGSYRNGEARGSSEPDLAGGIKATTEAVSALTGVRFDGTAAMTFDGLRALTDAVGGVPICLPQQVRSFHTSRVFPAGCQRLDGRGALDLLRQRYALPQGAHDRDRNGQRYVKGLLAELARAETLKDPAKLTAILDAISKGLILELAGRNVNDFIDVLTVVVTAEPVGIGWTFKLTERDEATREWLDPTISAGLFDALRQDSLADWVAANPKLINR